MKTFDIHIIVSDENKYKFTVKYNHSIILTDDKIYQSLEECLKNAANLADNPQFKLITTAKELREYESFN